VGAADAEGAVSRAIRIEANSDEAGDQQGAKVHLTPEFEPSDQTQMAEMS
jgi:hypothetical protein